MVPPPQHNNGDNDDDEDGDTADGDAKCTSNLVGDSANGHFLYGLKEEEHYQKIRQPNGLEMANTELYVLRSGS